jgi:chemotaxis protein CheC
VSLSPLQLDALRELVNIGVGRAASSLNDMLESPIKLDVPELRMLTCQELGNETGDSRETFSCVQLGFKGSFSGVAALVFPQESAIKLVSALTNEEPETPGLNGLMAGTLNEVGNIVINCVIGTLANILESPFDFTFPHYLHGLLKDLLTLEIAPTHRNIMMVRTHFVVENRHVEGNIFLVFEAASFDALLTAIDHFHE